MYCDFLKVYLYFSARYVQTLHLFAAIILSFTHPGIEDVKSPNIIAMYYACWYQSTTKFITIPKILYFML